jgi:uncharacterized protein YjbI with pentapeptide repeats
MNTNFKNADLTNAYLVNAKVSDVNWITNLKEIGVKGAIELEKRYKVNPTKQSFENPYVGIWEGYLIEERISQADEAD